MHKFRASGQDVVRMTIELKYRITPRRNITQQGTQLNF